VKRSFRLTKSTDFRRVRRLGKSYAHPFVVLIALPNECGHSRVGVAAGRSLGGAVARNRAKRVLRAAAAPLLSRIMSPHDVILLARRPILEQKSPAVTEALGGLLKRAQLLSKD